MNGSSNGDNVEPVVVISHPQPTQTFQKDLEDSSERLRTPLLQNEKPDIAMVELDKVQTENCCIGLLQELHQQAKMAFPLSLNFFLNYLMPITTLSFAGFEGTLVLAAVTLGNTCSKMFGQFVLMGLLGALDTQASQAYGSGRTSSLSVIFQRAVLFMWLHAIPISIGFLFVADGLRWLGYDPKLCDLVQQFMYGSLPMLWLETLNRPLNRILVAQRVTGVQLWVALVASALHVLWNYIFLSTLRWGALGAAFALAMSSGVTLLLTSAAILALKKQDTVWGRPTKTALQQMVPFARLAYPAALMRCMESGAFSGLMIAAGALPHPQQTVAALGVSMSVYGALYMPYVATSIAAGTRVGNALGAGDAAAARRSAVSCLLSVPVVWWVIALVTMVPACSRWVVRLFTDASDVHMMQLTISLLFIVGILELADGIQTNLSGVVQGLGKQSRAVVVNVVAYYVVAIPLALLLGFHFQLGAQGLMWGLLAGPVCQALCYAALLLSMDWEQEARVALQRVSSQL